MRIIKMTFSEFAYLEQAIQYGKWKAIQVDGVWCAQPCPEVNPDFVIQRVSTYE